MMKGPLLWRLIVLSFGSNRDYFLIGDHVTLGLMPKVTFLFMVLLISFTPPPPPQDTPWFLHKWLLSYGGGPTAVSCGQTLWTSSSSLPHVWRSSKDWFGILVDSLSCAHFSAPVIWVHAVPGEARGAFEVLMRGGLDILFSTRQQMPSYQCV